MQLSPANTSCFENPYNLEAQSSFNDDPIKASHHWTIKTILLARFLR